MIIIEYIIYCHRFYIHWKNKKLLLIWFWFFHVLRRSPTTLKHKKHRNIIIINIRPVSTRILSFIFTKYICWTSFERHIMMAFNITTNFFYLPFVSQQMICIYFSCNLNIAICFYECLLFSSNTIPYQFKKRKIWIKAKYLEFSFKLRLHI